MAKPHVYNAVRDSFTILGTFFAQVATEVGKERAIEMYGKFGGAIGEMIGNMIKDHRGDRKPAKRVGARLRELYEKHGIDARLEIGQTVIKAHSNVCPIYDGLMAAGIDHETIEAMCRSALACQAASLGRVVPDAGVSLTKFRAKPDDFCTEETTLA